MPGLKADALRALVDKLAETHSLSPDEYEALIAAEDVDYAEYLYARAGAAARREFGDAVYLRGLIEISNICANNCYYCGIRAGNAKAHRYRLSADDILACCAQGHELGFRTLVLQGGEDPFFSRDMVCSLVSSIKQIYPDCAVTLSLGEKEGAEYQAYFDAGADRYLLRHETADSAHYALLHPAPQRLESRMRALHDLKRIGFQVGTGFMVGSPHQTNRHIAMDLRFISEFAPHMVGIGPFVRHGDTPFAAFASGSLDKCLRALACVRLMLPRALIPATTALGALDPYGREKGILAGANVVMPNLSPPEQRGKYMLYDNKPFTGVEAAEGLRQLGEKLAAIGYSLSFERGDWQGKRPVATSRMVCGGDC